MIDLPTLQQMWEKDSKIDIDNLHTESLNIPVLHAKYYDIYNNFMLLRKKAEQQKARDQEEKRAEGRRKAKHDLEEKPGDTTTKQAADSNLESAAVNNWEATLSKLFL